MNVLLRFFFFTEDAASRLCDLISYDRNYSSIRSDTHSHTLSPSHCLHLILLKGCSVSPCRFIPYQNEPHLLLTFFYPASKIPILTVTQDNSLRPPSENAGDTSWICGNTMAQISKMYVTILLNLHIAHPVKLLHTHPHCACMYVPAVTLSFPPSL